MEYYLRKCVLGYWTARAVVPGWGNWYKNSECTKAWKNVTSHNAYIIFEYKVQFKTKFKVLSLSLSQFPSVSICKLKQYFLKTPFQKFTIKRLHWSDSEILKSTWTKTTQTWPKGHLS